MKLSITDGSDASEFDIGDVDPRKIVKRIAGYFVAKAKVAFAQNGPGWPALSEATLKHREKKAVAGLERKLKRDVKRAEKKAKTFSAVERRLAVLAEFRRLEAGGRTDVSLLTEKQSKKLQERVGRTRDRSKDKLLGGLARSIKRTISGNSATIGSKATWAGVHNQGGIGGNGAQEPKRTFLVIEDSDLDICAEIVLDEMEKAINGG